MNSVRPIAVLCGGVGAARLLRALLDVVDPSDVCAVVNTGDDTVMHGLHISPDIDTVTYTVAGAIDPERGWGLVGETWTAVGALERYAAVRPSGSRAGATWFGLGDRDLATHMYRSGRLAEGASLTEVTAEIVAAWGLDIEVLPMTDDPAPTRVGVDPAVDPGPDGDGMIPFQDYFVRHRHAVATTGLDLGASRARANPRVIEVLSRAETVIIAPSNPLVSIGPIRALPGIDEALAGRRSSVVAVSPIVGGAALKGPAAEMMADAGITPDVVGIAETYRGVAATLVIDPVDTDLADAVSAAGMRPIVTPSVMSDPKVAAALARATLAAARV